MLRFGIRRFEHYNPKPTGISDRFRNFFTAGHTSYELLRTSLPANPREVAAFEAIMRQMQLKSGIFRTTFRGRFQELNRFINALLTARYAPGQPLTVHDWAASDCLTSAEWARALFALRPATNLTASDLALYLVELTYDNGDVFILESGGEPLQYIKGPFVIKLNPPEPHSLIVNRWLSARARRKFASLEPALRPHLRSVADGTTHLPGCNLRKILLIHPDAEALRATDPRFSIVQHSVFEQLPAPADIIRSMNIFNLGYFPEPQLKTGIRAVWASLQPAGWWIVGRTYQQDPPAHDASVFEKQANGFRLLEKYGRGSEIEHLVLDDS